MARLGQLVSLRKLNPLTGDYADYLNITNRSTPDPANSDPWDPNKAGVFQAYQFADGRFSSDMILLGGHDRRGKAQYFMDTSGLPDLKVRVDIFGPEDALAKGMTEKEFIQDMVFGLNHQRGHTKRYELQSLWDQSVWGVFCKIERMEPQYTRSEVLTVPNILKAALGRDAALSAIRAGEQPHQALVQLGKAIKGSREAELKKFRNASNHDVEKTIRALATWERKLAAPAHDLKITELRKPRSLSFPLMLVEEYPHEPDIVADVCALILAAHSSRRHPLRSPKPEWTIAELFGYFLWHVNFQQQTRVKILGVEWEPENKKSN